jgi:hypothetical protein
VTSSIDKEYLCRERDYTVGKITTHNDGDDTVESEEPVMMMKLSKFSSLFQSFLLIKLP